MTEPKEDIRTIIKIRILKKEIKSERSFLYQFCRVIGRSAFVAIGIHEHLRVGMDGDEGLDVAMRLHEVHNRLDLRLRVCTGSTIGF